jgi:type IV pilus assembly protein PilB
VSGLDAEFGVSLAEVPKMLAYGKGCPTCKGTGYKGRTAIYEFLPVTDPVKELILSRSSSQDIARAAQAPAAGGAPGMRMLRQDGWRKILLGQTTPEEVLRVS